MVLVVRLEIWSGDEEDLPVELAVLEAENISDLADVSDYQISVRQIAPHPGGHAIDADFKLTAHRRDLGAWRLVRDALDVLLDDRPSRMDESKPGATERARDALPFREMAGPDDIALIEQAFPPGETVPHFDVPRFWSNAKLRDPDTIIALVLEKPTTEDLARTIASYGPRRVIAVLHRLAKTGDLSADRIERVCDWLGPIINGVAEAARELVGDDFSTKPAKREGTISRDIDLEFKDEAVKSEKINSKNDREASDARRFARHLRRAIDDD